MGVGRRAFRLAMSALVVGAGLVACAATDASPSDDRHAAESQTPVQVRVSVTVADRSLAATEAIADFGITKGVRLVPVRIVDAMQIRVRVETAATFELAEAPHLCLFWEFAAPDDAGLESRCWGKPDLDALVAAQLERGPAGQLVLGADRSVEVVADLQRGEGRCDYPPGSWRLETTLVPLIDGKRQVSRELPPVSFEVSAEESGPLAMLRFNTRFCGLATIVYLDQGEPQLATP